jgi:hypothetical protein
VQPGARQILYIQAGPTCLPAVPRHLPSLALPLGLQALSVCSSSSTRHEFRFALVLLAGAGGFTGGEGGILYERNRIFTASSVPRIFSFSLLLLLLPSIIVPTDRPTTRLLRIRGSFSKRRLFPVVAVLLVRRVKYRSEYLFIEVHSYS